MIAKSACTDALSTALALPACDLNSHGCVSPSLGPRYPTHSNLVGEHATNDSMGSFSHAATDRQLDPSWVV